MTVMAEGRAQQCGFLFLLKGSFENIGGSFYARVLMLPTHMEHNRAMKAATQKSMSETRGMRALMFEAIRTHTSACEWPSVSHGMLNACVQ